MRTLMNKDQQPRPWWKDNRLVWALAVLTLIGLVITAILGYLLTWEWTGLVGIPEHSETRLGWDWLELLIIPVLLGAGAFRFNQKARKGEQQQRENEVKIADQQRRNELEIADQQRKEDSLQRYLDRMQELLLDKGLRTSEKDAEIRATARARTLTVLRSLDGDRKGQVVRFLHEADLIGKAVREESEESRVIEAIIDLRTADLSFAFLHRADLNQANLILADLGDANLSGANLRDADLSDALLSRRQLAQAASLVGATLPDGTVIENEEGWEEFKKRYGQ
jgi:hypothetical protein